MRGALTTAAADAERRAIAELADAVEETIQLCEPIVDDLVERWKKAALFEFVGAGPLYGTAMFSAAKLLEASGDSALAQETRRMVAFAVFRGKRPIFRWCCCPPINLMPIARRKWRGQQKASGGRLPSFRPKTRARFSNTSIRFCPSRGSSPNATSSVVYSIPGELIAAARAGSLGVPYFCNFEGGRLPDWADRASRIRSSHMITELRR